MSDEYKWAPHSAGSDDKIVFNCTGAVQSVKAVSGTHIRRGRRWPALLSVSTNICSYQCTTHVAIDGDAFEWCLVQRGQDSWCHLSEYATLHTPERGISIISELCEGSADILSFLGCTVRQSVQKTPIMSIYLLEKNSRMETRPVYRSLGKDLIHCSHGVL